MKKNPALQDSPPAAGRTSDIFHSAAVRSSRSVFISRKAISYEIEKAPVPKGTEAKILIATCVEFHIPAYALIITVRVSVSAYCKVRAALVSPFTQIRNTAFPPPAALCHFFRLRYYSYSSVFLSILSRIIHRAAAQSQGKTQPKTIII